MKKKFPYNIEGLTWDAQHNTNMEDKYCYCGKGLKESQPMIRCDRCRQLFHRDCIECMKKPLLFGDTFGTFKCSVCNQGPETFERKPVSWITIVHLVIYNLMKHAMVEDAKKPKKDKREHYYFRWKEDVCAFIDDYWDYLMPDKTRSATWNNTIASVLSTHSNIFLSGLEKLHQSAWWTLRDFEPPKNEKKTKAAARPKPNIKRTLKRTTSQDAINNRPKRVKKDTESKPKQQEPQEDLLDLSSLSELSSAADSSDSENEIPTKKKNSQHQKKPVIVQTQEETEPLTEVEQQEQTVTITQPSVIREKSPIETAVIQPKLESTISESAKETYQLISTPNPSPVPLPSQSSTTLSSQQEWLLLQKLDHSSKKLPAVACRYKRKLAVRRLKRNLGIKLFDMDAQMIQWLRTTKHRLEPIVNNTIIQPASNQHIEQSPDDQQEAMLEKITFTPYACSFASRLYGSIRHRNTMTRDEPWLSSWNGRKLRPFIRRDFENKPKRMLLMGQIKACNGRPHAKGTPEPSGIVAGESIDYVYFQKEHLSQVNLLLSRSFWEGIDVSESLLFPEFSIVALYKRHVIGCAFMTPEAYITYFAVDPGWTNANIGQFMLYHLFQTAISKDITLHVSANNNAMILYQKFGFKPEEFIVNFYDKYLPADSVYSKNAFLLRLRR
ncbi:Cysteine-rich protein 2-binding protein [Choanephora cucurbitarum]|uniref:Cysteine-rich protein 2-binding protein n=2 Tax=Choanephora cucurbitarum TaxID=101091 RepID=A0A1C7N8E5_9FUNG|nr:Cysteine-rich protein 2-binding protein [Choanephora cucurbitarum]